MALRWGPKDPNEVLDYQLDWSERLNGDTISSSTWTVPSGITKDSDSYTTDAATIWLSGGTDGASYVLVNLVVTAGGRTLEESVRLTVGHVAGSLVGLDRAKQHLRVFHDDEDATIETYLAAAETIITEYLDREVYAEDGVASTGDDGTAIEITPAITAAILLLLSDMYHNRESDTWETDQATLPKTVRALLAPYRVWRVISEGC